MNDVEIRIACIQTAAATPGNPNHIQMAREYYTFVMEGQDDVAPAEGDVGDLVTDIEPTETPLSKSLKKGSRK